MLLMPSPRLTALGAILAIVAGAAPARAQKPAPQRAAITAVTMGMVYVGAGRTDGLREGSLLRVLRLGTKGQYRVSFVSSRSAAAKPDSESVLPAIGDSVEFTPVVEAPLPVAAQAAGPDSVKRTPASYAAAARTRGPRLRGRIGFRYLDSRDLDNGIDLKQPGIEALIDGPIAAGSAVGLAVDIRSRRTSLYRPGATATSTGLTSVYQAALRFQSPQGPFRAVFGRQYAPTLAGVGLFDGLSLDIQRSGWAGGVMAGLAPEPGTMAVSASIRQFGAYFQARNGGTRGARWSLTAGAIGSYASGGDVNREFGFLQATLFSPVVTAIALQEIDVNRGWKLVAGEKALSPTSTYLSLNVNPVRAVSLSAGFDNRRNVRLYQDLSTPESQFDARFRMGMWGGAYFIFGKLRFSGDVRTNTVGGLDSLRTTAYSGMLSLDRITRVGFGLRLRATRYETPARGPGTFLSGTLRIAPGALGAIELVAGSRQETGLVASDRRWTGFNAELFIRRSWFWMLNYSREWGPAGATPTTDLIYAGLSYRF